VFKKLILRQMFSSLDQPKTRMASFGAARREFIAFDARNLMVNGMACGVNLGDHLKTGHLWSLQNRPLWMV
jgi:hypothetical protein